MPRLDVMHSRVKFFSVSKEYTASIIGVVVNQVRREQ
jgi:hypothetical protein